MFTYVYIMVILSSLWSEVKVTESCPTLCDPINWSMEFSRPEHWSGQSFPPPVDLPNPGIEPRSPTLQADSLPAEPQWKPMNPGVGSLSLLQQIYPNPGIGFFTNWAIRETQAPYNFIFIFAYAGSLLLCRLFSSGDVWASCCGDFCCRPQALECADFSSCGLWAQ